MASVVLQTSLPGLTLWRRGKVRDVYDLGDRLLFVATDRISAFDSILPTGIPGKGQVLTRMSAFWFQHMRKLTAHHLISTEIPAELAADPAVREQLEGRTLVVARTEPVAFECVVRGYLAGSGWEDYRKSGAVCGIRLPPGLQQSQELEKPIFTPATKAETGHDINVPFEAMADSIGQELAGTLRDRSVAIYTEARAYARSRGILLADTKFEWGILNGKPILIDECLTPDSSRFWAAAEYRLGISPPSFDKQFVRDWLLASGWDRNPPAPPLPPEVAERTAARYREALDRLTAAARPAP